MPFLSTFLLLLCLNAHSAEIILFDGGKNHPHHLEVKKILEQELKLRCPGAIQIQEFSLFNSKGVFDSDRVVKKMKVLAKNKTKASILHFSWNDQRNSKYTAFENQLKAAPPGTFIVAAAGENVDDPNRILPLSETVMGSALANIKDAFIIGELNEKAQLAPRSHYGSELFTALPPAQNKQGSSFSAPLFTAYLACILALKSSRNPKDLLTMATSLRKKKDLASAAYPSLEDLFKD